MYYTPKIIEKNVVKLKDWIYEVEEYAKLTDSQEALFVLRAVLQQLRDNLPLAHIAHLNAQLPLFISGLFFEGWTGHTEPYKDRKDYVFLNRVGDKLSPHTSLDPEIAVRAVFATLASKVSSKEVEKLQSVLPRDIAAYFD